VIYGTHYANHWNGDCERLLLRLWLIWRQDKTLFDKQHQLIDGSSRCFNEMMSHLEQIKADTDRITFFEKICHNFRSCEIEYDKTQLLLLFCRVCVNSFSILNEDLNEIGTGIYIESSVFDHSCLPNAAPVFNGISLDIRAIKNIPAGQSIRINYVDLKANKDKRQTQLRRQYYFDCKCEKCESISDANIDFSLVKRLDVELDELIANGNDWHQAYSIGVKSIPVYHQIYGDYHPDISVQLMRVVKIGVLIQEDVDRNQLMDLFLHLQKSLSITHGPKHQLTTFLHDIILDTNFKEITNE